MQENPTALEVVAVALIDAEGRVLLQRRRAEARHGGLWEFPGGKVEAGESRESALIRELGEELGIAVAPRSLRFAAHSRTAEGGEAEVVLILYTCCLWDGEPQCLDAAEIGWYDPQMTRALAVPPLDVPLIEALPAIVAARLAEVG